MIYLTVFDPATGEVTGESVDSGFETLDDVELINGAPVRTGKRTRTYEGAFYSDYSVTGIAK